MGTKAISLHGVTRGIMSIRDVLPAATVGRKRLEN
jgi:hypothetical protein